MKKKVLGRGLGALIQESTAAETAPSEIDIDRITTNPDQPRLQFDEQRLSELPNRYVSTGFCSLCSCA